ncbi:carbamoyltransferase [Thermodesulfobacteriota bacterium]
MIRILGISPGIWISSAALIEDGKVLAASTEERFDRQKMSQAFPERAMTYCLNEAGISLNDVDCIVMPWNPGIHIQSGSLRYSKEIRWRGEYLYSIPSYILNKFHLGQVESMEEKICFKDKTISIFFISHHLAHAANAFFLSPFNEAAILTVDGKGEHETCILAMGNGYNIKKLKSISMPYSLGLLYGTVTEYLGFKPDSDEWKIMALASYGDRDNEYYQKMKDVISLEENGGFELDLSYFNYYLFDKQPTMYSSKMIELLGKPREKGGNIKERHMHIAAALQRVFEESITHLLQDLYEQKKCRNVVLSGGGFMNSVFNGKVLDNSPFEDVFISSCPDDSGTSVGAALYIYHCKYKKDNKNHQLHNYWGPSFSNEEIKDTLDKYKVKYQYYDDIECVAAELITNGSLVGWFQGRMEFGQRALGNRSILANPCIAEMKDTINKAVKYRESFRPFAPAILEEYTEEFFEIKPGILAPFMEKVYPIRKEKQELIPAVVHIDGSGRLQTVSKSINARFYKVIDEFRKLTGIPVLLNTSFNLNGEPIVCTPTDAIRTFFSCGLDYLCMGNYLVAKKG